MEGVSPSSVDKFEERDGEDQPQHLHEGGGGVSNMPCAGTLNASMNFVPIMINNFRT